MGMHTRARTCIYTHARERTHIRAHIHPYTDAHNAHTHVAQKNRPRSLVLAKTLSTVHPTGPPALYPPKFASEKARSENHTLAHPPQSILRFFSRTTTPSPSTENGLTLSDVPPNISCSPRQLALPEKTSMSQPILFHHTTRRSLCPHTNPHPRTSLRTHLRLRTRTYIRPTLSQTLSSSQSYLTTANRPISFSQATAPTLTPAPERLFTFATPFSRPCPIARALTPNCLWAGSTLICALWLRSSLWTCCPFSSALLCCRSSTIPSMPPGLSPRHKTSCLPPASKSSRTYSPCFRLCLCPQALGSGFGLCPQTIRLSLSQLMPQVTPLLLPQKRLMVSCSALGCEGSQSSRVCAHVCAHVCMHVCMHVCVCVCAHVSCPVCK